MHFPPGSLVRARGREWVVQPESTAEFLRLRPLTGSDIEATGILTALEAVGPASFPPPSPEHLGDHRSCKLLRDAIRLQIRNAAGPFRSLGKIAVEPRSYQLVPLLMALKQEPVRLLIADDVGIGKTVEAALVAKELLERGDANGLAVLCPPHLAEQWQRELLRKFHIDAALVLAGTAARLERACRTGESLFDRYPHTVVSLDFIKSDRRREAFLRSAPNLIIVDEAHTCASGGGRHQRHSLLKDLARKDEQHLLLVTATPHSGDQTAFHSLLGVLDPAFADLPDDLTREEAKPHRQRLARHLVQRRRADIEHFLDDQTPFPRREGEREVTWSMSPRYRALFDKVLDYARELVAKGDGRNQRARVHWWSALAALRSVGSSPAAASATLRSRAPHADGDTAADVDAIGQKLVLDQDEAEGLEGVDLTPGVLDAAANDPEPADGDARTVRNRLLALAREAEKFLGDEDAKLKAAIELVKELLKQGKSPILFCRFIPTAEYVADQLRKKLRSVDVRAVTGNQPPEAREKTIEEMGKSEKRVLVCTDCLSEGVNLQGSFDAVVHYDLAWNPTRHEQREGRVDRYGQTKPTVRLITLYGDNSPIDGIVLDVLLRKHRTIRSALGVSIALPEESNKIVDALMEGLLLRTGSQKGENLLPGMAEYLKPRREDLHRRWDLAADREKRSRTLFAQDSLKPQEVLPELAAVRRAIGSRDQVRAFVTAALQAHGAQIVTKKVDGLPAMQVKLDDQLPRGLCSDLRRAVGEQESLLARFELPTPAAVVDLPRTHPFVETLANHTVDGALDPQNTQAAGRRAGAIRTTAVDKRTTLCLLRLRYEIHEQRAETSRTLLLEDVQLAAFRGSPKQPEWLDQEAAEALLLADPSANLGNDQARDAVQKILGEVDALSAQLASLAEARASALLDAHRRVRHAARLKGIKQSIEWKPPLDWLGTYVFLPAGGL
ncbi:MAG: helicase-related protein [Planctomycetota bacterium]